jgi:hypothetical protein
MRSLLGPVNPKVSFKAGPKDIDCQVSLEFLRRGWELCKGARDPDEEDSKRKVHKERGVLSH